MTEPLWRPSEERIAKANLTEFLKDANARHGLDLKDYGDLHRWSVGNLEDFWTLVWDFCGVIAEGETEPVILDADKMPGARFFPEVRLNYAENLLRNTPDLAGASGDAIVFWGEDKVKRRLSHAELYESVSRLQQALRDAGIGAGDRVAGFLPNLPESVMAMLAATSLGAIWSSCSPDFGVQGVLDRFGQIEPKALFVPDGYHYNGKALDSLARVAEFSKELPSVERIVVCPYLAETPDLAPLDGRAVLLADFIAAYGAREIGFTRLPFNAPLYIMFSSGTTGKPKCIVHGAGGTLLKHLSEQKLSCDIQPDDRVFYFTTCGWMMWNWLVSALASEATLMLYDGSPFYPDGKILWDFAQAEKISLFGTSAKYIDALNKQGYAPKDSHSLPRLRSMTSTGSPLVPEGFDYVYDKIKGDLCLSSISGGTDIVGCFVLGNPIGPVWRGEIQAGALGLDVQVWNEEGRPVIGEKGELVCLNPFPSMPLAFWNDPDGSRYRAAYFERFPGVWCHGDFAEKTARDGFIIYGRSDATLNPGGVRIGTAEIYRQVEKLEEVEESIVIGQDWEGDTRVVLFVKLRGGAVLDEDLIKRIKTRIK
ncbi:MAG: acetoacetate--CoA ligase, partial [Rhodovibrionaceae bacterium]